MNQTRFYGWRILPLGVLLCLGCGAEDAGPKTYPVSGTVTFKGAPAEGVAVSFIPEGSGQSAVGVTDGSGKYQLTTRKQGDGAVPGRYKVTFAKYEGGAAAATGPNKVHADYDISNEYAEGYDESAAGSAAASKNLFPKKYADPSTSGQTAEVVEGNNTFDFSLDG